MASTFVDRVATTDPGYVAGDLSIYPAALDDQYQLYTVANNATTTTAQSASYNSPYFIVQSTAGFPAQGIIMVGTEQVYYTVTTANSFSGLKRGFAGSQQQQWPVGTPVYGCVAAEPHNAVRDALTNIENNLGLQTNPLATSLNGLLTALETRFYSPRPVFRATPRYGAAPLNVTFQNFSEGSFLRFFWDFGDGSTSQDFAPTHTYLTEGNFNVSLNVITTLKAQGVATKTAYINVGTQYTPAFFYVTPETGTVATTFDFIDQTEGAVTSRYWTWGDGTITTQSDPNVHTATHQYTATGSYNPTLMIIFSDGTKKTVGLAEPVTVT